MSAQDRFLIVNADDFGASRGINRGILECHTRGVVTSASLMVDGRAVADAIAISRDHPALSIGLHWDVVGEDDREFDLSDHQAARAEFDRQLDRFVSLVGRAPTHVDSHKHVHRHEALAAFFHEIVRPLGVPVRGSGPVVFIGGFYGQWEYGVPNLEHVGVEHLRQLLRDEIRPGWTELSCHPGYATPEYASIYAREREVEIRTLTDRRVREAIETGGIRLVNYDEYARVAKARDSSTSGA